MYLLLVHVCVNNLSFHCAFWCNKQYFFQLSKQCAWLRAVTPQNVILTQNVITLTQNVIKFLTQNVIIFQRKL